MCGTSLNVGEAFDTHDATTQIPMSDVGGAKKADSNYLKIMRMDTPQKTTTILETRPIFRDTLLYHVFFTRLKQDRQKMDRITYFLDRNLANLFTSCSFENSSIQIYVKHLSKYRKCSPEGDVFISIVTALIYFP